MNSLGLYVPPSRPPFQVHFRAFRSGDPPMNVNLTLSSLSSAPKDSTVLGPIFEQV